MSRVGGDDAQLWIWRVPKSRRRVGGGGWVRACGAHPMVVASAQKSSSSSSKPTVKPMAATRQRPRAQTEWREPSSIISKVLTSLVRLSRRPVSPNEWFPRVLYLSSFGPGRRRGRHETAPVRAPAFTSELRYERRDGLDAGDGAGDTGWRSRC